MSEARMKAIDEKLEKDIAKLNAEVDKKLAVVRDYENDPSLEAPVKMAEGFSTCVVVENVPQVDEAMKPRLISVLSQIFGRCGKIAADGIYMPIDPETKKAPGFVIVEYETADQAKTAVKSLDKLALDKVHTFKVSHYSVLLAADNTPDEYVEPKVTVAEKANLQHHLLDGRGIDQFVTHFDQTVQVDWNTFDYEKTWNDPAQRTPEVYWKKDGWAGVHFSGWSTKGSYMVTGHPQGIMCWGGPPPFEKPLCRFDHPGVSKFSFSPNEKFLVTASVKGKAEDAKEDDPKVVVFHDVATGKRKLEFTGVKSNAWPLFRWSHDDAYFATVVKDKIQVYESATMKLLGGASLRVPGVKTFAWSPTANVIAYYVPVPEDGNHPAGLTVLEIPSKKVVRQKNLFDVKDCRLHWHPSGAYLCAKVDRLMGNKKKNKTARVFFGKDVRVQLLEKDPDLEPVQINRKIDELWEKAGGKVKDHYEKMAQEDKARFQKELNFTTSFQVFRFDIKGCPVEEVEFDKNNPVVAFAWQPCGNMFAVIHGKNSLKPDVSIYGVKKEGLVLRKTLEGKPCNALFWSPVNDFLVLSNCKSNAGNLEFYHAGLLESIHTAEHQGASDFQWDPRGRFFTSIVSAWRGNGEAGYYLWNFNGKLLAKFNKPKFYEFHWRPRPVSLLTNKEEKKVLKKMKEATARFAKEDELRRRLERKDFFIQRMAVRKAYYENMKELMAEYEVEVKKHEKLFAKMKREEEVETVEEMVETVVDEKTTIL